MAKIWIEAYGCSASFADSEMISGIVANGGHVLAESEHDADASILVTCSVKDSTAGRMAYRIKKLGKKPLVVAGCLAKAEPETVWNLLQNMSLVCLHQHHARIRQAHVRRLLQCQISSQNLQN